MSAARQLARAATEPGAVTRPPVAPGRAAPPRLVGRLAARLGQDWLQRAAWTISRTGRLGLVGIALLLAAALFLFSTYLPVAAEVEAMRSDLASAQRRPRTPVAEKGAAPATTLPALPARTDMPAILRQLFATVLQARLALETGKYEISAARSGGVVRHQVTFPVTGPYPQIRSFIDTVLATMPAVALSDLVLERKSIGDGQVEAQIRLTVYTAAAGTAGRPESGSAATGPERPVSEARQESDRVVASSNAPSLFAPHSWYVRPPPKPPPPPPPAPPPPEPTAPPFPYAFVGNYAPEGEAPVYFLSRGDRVVDARVGDRLDGVYQFESAANGQLVFVYLPLNIRQTIQTKASK